MNSTLSLNEQISTMLEPKPTYHAPFPMYESALKYWQWDFRKLEWFCVEWDTDEAACARLLDVMPWPIVFKNPSNKNWTCRTDYRIAEYAQESADRKAAICKAFIAYFSGLSAEAQEQCRKDLAK